MSEPRILVVEDETIVAMGIEHHLEDLGYVVAGVASSGELALTLAQQIQPDLVLMDIQLQDEMDGIEAARQLHARFNIPVVYLTAHADQLTLDRAKITGPFGYITKPFQERDLHTTIEIALYKHQMEQKLAEREQWLHTTLRSIGDAVIATDNRGQIIFMNPVAEKLIGCLQADANGQNLVDIFRIIDEETEQPLGSPASHVIKTGETVELSNHTLLITRDNNKIPIADSVAPITDPQGQVIGAVLVFQDITQRRQAEQERERLITDLQEALDTIKVLSGIIPICASCKKIRDDQGDWYPPEVYIREHSDAEFSHGICPDCAERLYPDFYHK